MKISIVTPSLNQGKYIEDTIHSVLNQDYPEVEHIIIDGGSSDGTIDILKKYQHLKWISEKDTGQANAINKGFRIATGELIAWLNSDDYYENNSLYDVANYFDSHKECMFLYGDMTLVDENKNIIELMSGENLSRSALLRIPDIVRQPSCFWRSSLFADIGYLREDIHLVFDYEFLLRIGKRFKYQYINKNLSYLRIYADTKTQRMLNKQFYELKSIMLANIFELSPISYKFLLGRYLDSIDKSNVIYKILNPLRKAKHK
jgi:glycosyltransferase involved in cell wall biosynthesis